MDKTENFEKHTSLKHDENVSVSSENNELQITKESILQSDQIQETFKKPNVSIATAKRRKFVKCKYCSDNFHSKLKFQVHRNLCKVYHKFIGKRIRHALHKLYSVFQAAKQSSRTQYNNGLFLGIKI